MPAISEARIAANRANALKSTGPKTSEGKERSRQNGLKHGMAGAGVVLPEGDLSEVELRGEALTAELAPRSMLGAILVGQMATLSVRMERGARQEEASLATRVRRSGEAFDRGLEDEADRLMASLADDPRRVVEQLRRSAEGVDRLSVAWGDLRALLASGPWPNWNSTHHARTARLAGLVPDEPRASSWLALSKATWGNFEGLKPDEGAGLDPKARQAWAVSRLLGRLDGAIAELEAHRATLDHEAVALDRLDAADVALFDPSREAALARRYEAEARRGFFRALREFREADARSDAEAAPTPEAEEAPVGESGPLGSSREGPRPHGRRTRPAFSGAVAAMSGDSRSVALGVEGRVVAAGRAAVVAC